MIEIIFDVQLFEIVVKGPSLYKTTNCIKRNPQPPQASFMCIPRTAAARDVRHRIPGLSLQWRHNGVDGVSNHQPHECLLNRLFRCRSKKTKLRVTGLCVGNSPVTGEFPAQTASNAENVSISWRHLDYSSFSTYGKNVYSEYCYFCCSYMVLHD